MRSRTSRQPAAVHANPVGRESIPARFDFVPRHRPTIGEIDVSRIATVSNHPMSAGQVETKEFSVGHSEHEDHRVPSIQLLLDSCRAMNLGQLEFEGTHDALGAAPARADPARELIGRVVLFQPSDVSRGLYAVKCLHGCLAPCASSFFWRLPPRDSNAQRRSRTGGFAYQAANHARWLATTFYPWPTQSASAHLKMFSLASDPSKPGAGETLLTGG